jgi:apolipoprotein D and lipocalin family protein
MQLTIIIAVTAVLGIGAFILVNAGSPGIPPLRTVEKVDLTRYLGSWHEIARLPNRFQSGCAASSAEYSLRENGEITVINSCRNDKDNSIRQVKGRAWSVDVDSNARLKVSFFWPFRGDYWIIELGKEYEYSVVGTPDRKYLWVLSRTATMDNDLFSAILQRAQQQGFDSGAVVRETAVTQKPYRCYVVLAPGMT